MHIEQSCTVYPWMNNSGFPADHPRSALFVRRYDYLITDRVPQESLIRDLFLWDPLTEFVREALGFEMLYRSACPTESIQVNYMNSGDVLRWHFDTNDGVVSLLLDCAEEGGRFQVAPCMRDEADEQYDLVSRAFDLDPEVVLQPEMAPGTFVLAVRCTGSRRSARHHGPAWSCSTATTGARTWSSRRNPSTSFATRIRRPCWARSHHRMQRALW